MANKCIDCIYSLEVENDENIRLCNRYPNNDVNIKRKKIKIKNLKGITGSVYLKRLVSKDDVCGEFTLSSSSSSYSESSSSLSSKSFIDYVILDEANDKQILLTDKIGNMKIFYNTGGNFVQLSCWTTGNQRINIDDIEIANKVLELYNIDYVII